MVAKSDIIDSAVADAAFSLKPGETSAPVKGRFGTVLLQVGKIEPGEEKTYEQVAAQIKREMAESRAKSEVGNLRDKIEDERAAGSTLAETAKKLGLKSVSIEAVDRSGRGLDGKPVTGLPQTPNVISAAFAADVGVDTDPLQLPGGGYLYYDVTGVTPSRERPLEEVKDQVTARWRDDEIAKRLQARPTILSGSSKRVRRLPKPRAKPASRSRPPKIFNAAKAAASFLPKQSRRSSARRRARRPARKAEKRPNASSSV